MFGKTEQLKEEEMKQTAVEWLINELDKYNKGVSDFFSDVAIKNHALRIEKEQIMKAVSFGDERGNTTKKLSGAGNENRN